CSARSAVIERVRPRYAALPLHAAACVALILSLAGVADLAAQQPSLRITGASAVTVQGTEIDGAAAFPARTLESLGFRIGAAPAGFMAILGEDTLQFWNTSPFFRSGA